jgi:hypothetical protein
MEEWRNGGMEEMEETEERMDGWIPTSPVIGT